MRQKTVVKNVLQSVTEVYYKVRQILQSVAGITKCDRFITKCVSYYKVWQIVITKCVRYYKVWKAVITKCVRYTKCDSLLLQSASGITKSDSYYKVRHNKALLAKKLWIKIFPNIIIWTNFKSLCYSNLMQETQKISMHQFSINL